jgi:hypothetical protein
MSAEGFSGRLSGSVEGSGDRVEGGCRSLIEACFVLVCLLILRIWARCAKSNRVL